MRVKVLNFITKFDVGGTERQFVHLTRNLDRSRFDVRIGCLSRAGPYLKEVEMPRIPISEYRIRSLFRIQAIRQQAQLARDIRRNGIHVLHAFGFYPNVFSVPAATLGANCVTIASVRDTGVFSNRKKLKSVAQKFACRLADRIIANSEAVRDWLLSLGVDGDKIQVIPNGVDIAAAALERRDFPIRRELGVDPNVPVVAVVCRLNPGKGLEDFLEAAVRVRQRYPSARFLIVGDSRVNPAYKTALEDLCGRLNLKHTVIFTGERHDVQRLLPEVNVSVLPSLSEGLSNSVLEAMAARLPVVATRVGGNPEIVENEKTGLLVPPRDAEALSNAIIRILESPDLAKRFGEAGRERVATRFSLEAMVRSTEDLYMSLVEEKIFHHARGLTV